jgi:hypothetical protein
MRNAGRWVTRAMIIEHVWNLSFDSSTNLIDVDINYGLRVTELMSPTVNWAKWAIRSRLLPPACAHAGCTEHRRSWLRWRRSPIGMGKNLFCSPQRLEGEVEKIFDRILAAGGHPCPSRPRMPLGLLLLARGSVGRRSAAHRALGPARGATRQDRRVAAGTWVRQ